MLTKDLKIFLTATDPFTNQLDMADSIGGYISNNLYYAETPIIYGVGKYDGWADVADYSILENATHININEEIIKISKPLNNHIQLEQRGVFGDAAFHAPGDFAKAIGSPLFNDKYNSHKKQYRCLAIKNVNSIFTASNVSIVIVSNSEDVYTKVSMAIEIPKHDVVVGTATSDGTKMKLIDSSLSTYSDGFFNNSVIYFTNSLNIGQNVIISSFTQSTGELVFTTSLSYDTAIGDTYMIYPAPASRLQSGIDENIIFGSNVSSFVSEGTIDIDFNSRVHGDDLYPGDVFYVWLEKTLLQPHDEYLNNGFSWYIKMDE